MTTYIIKSILCSGIFLLIYHLFLEQEKMHRFNRFYLLLSIAFAFSIPLLSVEMAADVAPQLTKNPAILLGSSENVSIIQSEPSYETAEKKMLTDKMAFLSVRRNLLFVTDQVLQEFPVRSGQETKSGIHSFSGSYVNSCSGKYRYLHLHRQYFCYKIRISTKPNRR